MKYVFLILILPLTIISARENPFAVTKASISSGKATHVEQRKESFEMLKTQLPSSARILKGVEFHFQNLDGSIEIKKIDVDKSIDWHDKLEIRKITNSNILVGTRTKLPKVISEKKLVKIDFRNTIFFTIDKKSLHVKTADIKIRDFLVTNPHKIVIDFKKSSSFPTKVYNLKTKYFKSITIGNHSGYYRVVILLDGEYLYRQEKAKDGYIFSLK